MRRLVRRWHCAVGSCSRPRTAPRISDRRELSCNPVTVGKWRTRFAAKGLDGLIDEPWPGQPRKITDEIVKPAIVATLESTPDDGPLAYYARSPEEVDDLAADQLERFPEMLVYRVAALLDAGIEVVPTFRTRTSPSPSRATSTSGWPGSNAPVTTGE